MATKKWLIKVGESVAIALDRAGLARSERAESQSELPWFSIPPPVDAFADCARVLVFSDDISANVALVDAVRGKEVTFDLCVLVQSRPVEELAAQLRECAIQAGVWPFTIRLLSDTLPDLDNPYFNFYEGMTVRRDQKWTWTFKKDQRSQWPQIVEHIAESLKTVALPEIYKLGTLDGIIDYASKNEVPKLLRWESYICALLIRERFDLLEAEFSPVDPKSEKLTVFAKNVLRILQARR